MASPERLLIVLRELVVVAAVGLVGGCTPSGTPSTTSEVTLRRETPTTTIPVAGPTTTKVVEQFPGGRSLWRVDPATLEKVKGSALGPTGSSLFSAAATEGEAALVGINNAGTRWVLWLLDAQSNSLIEIEAGGPRSPVPFAFSIEGSTIHWVTHKEWPGGDPNIPDGVALHRYDRSTGEVSTILELPISEGVYFDQFAYLSDRHRLALFGRSIGDGYPHVTVLNLDRGQVALDVALDTVPPVINVFDRSDDRVEPGWDRDRGLLYVPHLDTDFVTTVDLDSGSITTWSIVRKTSFLDRLIAAWQPTAQAKGASSEMTAAISSDGALLYLTGKELEWSDTVEGSYREKPLGIVAIDIETMTEVAHTELPISRLVISPTGETVLATGSWDDLIAGEFGNSSGLHLLDAKTLEPLLWIEPTDVPEYYELVYSADGRYAYGTEWFYGPSTIIVDTATLEVSQGPTLEAFNAELLQLGYVLDF